MFDICTGGTRLMTSDRIGDALIAHARATTTNGSTDIVDFPARAGGLTVVATLAIGHGIGFVALHSDDDFTPAWGSDELAAEVIKNRTISIIGAP